MRLLFALLVLSLTAPASADAYVVQERGGLEAVPNGITLGPDGNLWAVETHGKVVRMRPDGSVVARFVVGPDPTSITTGPGGRVWVAVTGADKLVWIDALSPTPTTHDVSTAGASNCGPVAVEAGGNGRIYFSMPNDGSGIGGCTNPNRIGYTNDDGSGGTVAIAGGRAYDLQVSGGKLFVPDFQADVIRRLSLASLAEETTVAVSGGNPDGITVDSAGRIWVTLFTAGKLAYFPAAQTGGAAVEVIPAGGTLSLPFGIVAAPDGFVYVAGRDSENLLRVHPGTLQGTYYPVPGARPWQIVNGPDEDLWFSDIGSARLMRFVNARPRATTGEARGLSASSATFAARVDPRGNATTVVFDYGPTTAYGQSTPPQTVPQGVGEVDVQAAVQDLAPSTTYHVRARATNAEGERVGADATFTTAAGVVDADGDRSSPPADCDDNDPKRHPAARDVPGDGIDQDCTGGDAPFPVLEAEPRFGWRFTSRATVLRVVRVERLRGGETIRVTCRGKRCPYRAKTFRKVRRGTRNLGRSFRGRRLPPRTQVRVTVTKGGHVGRVATLTTRAGRDPRIVRRCLAPGAKRQSRC